VNQLIKKANEFNLDLAIMFFDYNKAFYSLFHEKIWEALANQDVPIQVIRILDSIYNLSYAKIRLDKMGEIFPIQ